MRAFHFALGAAAMIMISGVAVASDKDKKSSDPGQKLVCKTDQFVGSLISRRICKTRAEWDQGAIDAKNALEERRGLVNPDLLPKPAG